MAASGSVQAALEMLAEAHRLGGDPAAVLQGGLYEVRAAGGVIPLLVALVDEVGLQVGDDHLELDPASWAWQASGVRVKS
jgi:hypothetical protein